MEVSGAEPFRPAQMTPNIVEERVEDADGQNGQGWGTPGGTSCKRDGRKRVWARRPDLRIKEKVRKRDGVMAQW